MSDPSNRTYKELQALWLERLQTASEHYRQASAIYRQAELDYTHRALPSPDGDLALRQAAKNENGARADYARTLRLFTDLLLNGTVPEDPPDDLPKDTN